MSFLSNPLALTVDEFRAYVAKRNWSQWKPQFIVLHNTAEPNLAQWSHFGLGKTAAVQRAKNLNAYYRDQEGWHSGPHIFVAPDLIIVACDLEADGVHASCYNRISIGVEMVGDYGVEDFTSGDGAKVRDNAVAALAILHEALKLSPDALHFHKQCARDHHDCPGKHVDKTDVIARVKGMMGAAPAAQAPVSGVKQRTGYSLAQLTVAKTLHDAFLTDGYSPAQAAGLVEQADAESSLNPKAVGDHDTAFGLFQLHAARIDLIRDGNDQVDGCGIDISTLPSAADQAKAVVFELRNFETHARAEILKAATAAQAGIAACTYYERPGAPGQAAKRAKGASEWFSYFNGV